MVILYVNVNRLNLHTYTARTELFLNIGRNAALNQIGFHVRGYSDFQEFVRMYAARLFNDIDSNNMIL